ncbi:MAG: TetR family transcriptional regulator [Clostridia bacterium]|nr:TetR family transcriptional regulator [Clostridia bacterium]
MPKGSPELKNARRTEIMNACKELYKTMNFKQITMKEIGSVTSFSRPTIYNYFQTKEEIFLALFRQEYELWNEDLQKIYNENDTLTREQLAHLIAASLQKRELMLKILSVNLYDMEENSRLELLVSFKKTFWNTIGSFNALVRKFCVEMDNARIEQISLAFFAYMQGIYPYAYSTDYQKKAMEQAGMPCRKSDIYEMAKLYFINVFNI